MTTVGQSHLILHDHKAVYGGYIRGGQKQGPENLQDTRWQRIQLLAAGGMGWCIGHAVELLFIHRKQCCWARTGSALDSRSLSQGHLETAKVAMDATARAGMQHDGGRLSVAKVPVDEDTQTSLIRDASHL